jgi:hypothetical protein
MLCGAQVAVCSEINTKHINTVWKNVHFLNLKPAGACNQWALKGYGKRIKYFCNFYCLFIYNNQNYFLWNVTWCMNTVYLATKLHNVTFKPCFYNFFHISEYYIRHYWRGFFSTLSALYRLNSAVINFFWMISLYFCNLLWNELYQF